MFLVELEASDISEKLEKKTIIPIIIKNKGLNITELTVVSLVMDLNN